MPGQAGKFQRLRLRNGVAEGRHVDGHPRKAGSGRGVWFDRRRVPAAGNTTCRPSGVGPALRRLGEAFVALQRLSSFCWRGERS